jgi:hypothetical protein
MTETQFTTGLDLPTWTVLVTESDYDEEDREAASSPVELQDAVHHSASTEPPLLEASRPTRRTGIANPNRSRRDMPPITPKDGSPFPHLSDTGKKAVWPIAIYNWLYQLDELSPHWASLIKLWLDLEELDRFAGTKRLKTKGRPAEVSGWVNSGRVQNYQPADDGHELGYWEKSQNFQRYRIAFRSWWGQLQPLWRNAGDGSHLQQDLPAPDIEHPWQAIDVTGLNGLTSVLAGLCIWALKIDQMPPSDKDYFVGDWLQTVCDVRFVVGEVFAARLS